MGVNFYVGAGLWGFAAALLINAPARRRQIGADAAIGIITTASFAFGVALISQYRRFTRNFDAALFGNILGVTNQDLIVVGGRVGGHGARWSSSCTSSCCSRRSTRRSRRSTASAPA